MAGLANVGRPRFRSRGLFILWLTLPGVVFGRMPVFLMFFRVFGFRPGSRHSLPVELRRFDAFLTWKTVVAEIGRSKVLTT